MKNDEEEEEKKWKPQQMNIEAYYKIIIIMIEKLFNGTRKKMSRKIKF